MTVLGFKTGPDGFGELIFMEFASDRARNRFMRSKSGPCMFEIGFFEHPRPRNEPHQTILKLPNHSVEIGRRGCRNHLEPLLRPKTRIKKWKHPENPENPKNPENPIRINN